MHVSGPGGGRRSRQCCLLLCLLLLLHPDGGWAESDSPPPTVESTAALPVADEPVAPADAPALPGDEAVIELPPVLVTGQTDSLTGSSSWTRESLRTLPTGTANATDFAAILPGVLGGNAATRSTTGGELLPALLSISGGKADQNAFSLDGAGAGNRLDPLADNPEDPVNVPAHPQGLFPHARLIESLTIFDHDIPARYGSFTGGMILVDTRQPSAEAEAGVNLRATRSNWTWFHVPAEQQAEFSASATYKKQPHFTKEDGGLDLSLPTGDDGGFLGAYQQTRSRLGLRYQTGSKTQTRQLENYLAKWTQQVGPRQRLEISLLATPYLGRYFLKDGKESDYTLKNAATALQGRWRQGLPFGDWELDLAYTTIGNVRTAPQHYWNWAKTPSRNWGTGTISPEGGFGDIEKNQRNLSLSSHLALTPVRVATLRHAASLGLAGEWVSGRSVRKETTVSYGTATIVTVPLDCGGDRESCVDNEQYFRFRRIYDPFAVEVEKSSVAFYVADRIEWGRLMLRPGWRFSYDTYSDNRDAAPRFSAALDLFGTRLLAGANRYYGTIPFTEALRAGEKPTRAQTRTRYDAPWVETVSNSVNRLSDMRTPYVDEVSAGIEQPLPVGRLELDYIYRRGRDEIARQIDSVVLGGRTLNVYHFNNNGRSHYESYRGAWGTRWPSGEVLLNLSRQEATTSVEEYDDFLSDLTADRRVYYNGRPINREGLPRLDYNRSWVGNLVWLQRLPAGFEFSNVTRYKGASHVLQDTKRDVVLPSGETADEYREAKTPPSWTFDWKLAWHQAVGAGEVILSFEVLNVFNHSNRISGEMGNYEAGRQIWAGVEGRF